MPIQLSGLGGRQRRKARRRGPRSRKETAEERRRLQEATDKEIDQIAAEFHAQLPKEKAKGIGAIYARYSSRFQHSIADQVRTLFQAALKLEIFVPRNHVFFDLAVRGYKSKRPGLDQLRPLLTRKAFDVFFVFTTNRLFRKTYKALQFVEEEVVERGLRCLFVKSGVDTSDDKRWRMLLQFHAAADEFVVGMYGDNIRAAHEGLFGRQMVCGTISFGYQGEPIPGEFTKLKRPRCMVVIEPEAAGWVAQIFEWFVHNLLSIDEIARRLNADPNIPLGPKCVSGQWTHQAVRGVLTNERYRGEWAYGAKENVWQSKADYSRQVPRAEPLCSAQFEKLRIISDELWYAAQKRLTETGGISLGRKFKDGDRKAHPLLLNGLYRCPAHNDQPLYVGGAKGEYMYCRACRVIRAEDRPLYSQLPRKLALQLTCETLASLIQQDGGLVAQVITACQAEAVRHQQPDPTHLESSRKKEKQLSEQIQFILANAGETEADKREAADTLKRLRRERAEIAGSIGRLEAAGHQPIVVPTETEIQALMAELQSVLAAAAHAESETEIGTAREIIELLTGGRIHLYQAGERKAQRGWLQGRFQVRLLSFLIEKAIGTACSGTEETREVTIDYRELPPYVRDSERAKQLYDQGRMCAQIAEALKCKRSRVTKLINFWFESRGLPVPDGRTRRGTLVQKHMSPPPYQAIADQVMALWEKGLLLQEIAESLQCDRNTVTQAIAWWHEQRGLPVPDGRTRRKSLERKSSLPEAPGDRESDAGPLQS